tara:strand:+ start:414 stop:644 length:231 start_codon:yes stop_codon:yes gene_type:complete
VIFEPSTTKGETTMDDKKTSSDRIKLHNKHKCGERGLYIDGVFIFSSKTSVTSLFAFAIANGAKPDSVRIEFRSEF